MWRRFEMVGWFYINEEVAAPVRMLEADGRSGVITIELAARFVPNRSILRGTTVVEYRHWEQRRLVRCLGAERVGNALMIEAVDVGPALQNSDNHADTLGTAEDWLAIDGKAFCRVSGLHVNQQPTGHCLFHVSLIDWRDLRIGEDAPLACVGITLGAGPDIDGSITPLLHAARENHLAIIAPRIEIIRLRERQRIEIDPIATDWGDTTTLVVARVHAIGELAKAARPTAALAH